jgi:signal transduction histidine kinase
MCPEPRAHRASLVRWPALAAAALLGACALRPPSPSTSVRVQPPTPSSAPAQVRADPPAPAPDPLVPTTPAVPAVSMPVQGGLPGAARPDSSAVSHGILVYAERLRRLPSAELTQEVARLNDIQDTARQPSDDLQLALALAQTRAPNDLTRAQALAARVLNNPRDDARSLHPLAGLLAARLAEQRRVEEQLAQQTQQLREQQRRIDQLNERLEAVRAIERSLTSRPAPPNGSPKPQP